MATGSAAGTGTAAPAARKRRKHGRNTRPDSGPRATRARNKQVTPAKSRCGTHGYVTCRTTRPAQGQYRARHWRRRLDPYASWLSSGDNAWQMTAATLVGLMSIPALAVLYGGIVQRKWAVNTMMMVFSAFCLTLIVWVLWAFKMGFGVPWIGGSLHLLGKPGPVLGA